MAHGGGHHHHSSTSSGTSGFSAGIGSYNRGGGHHSSYRGGNRRGGFFQSNNTYYQSGNTYVVDHGASYRYSQAHGMSSTSSSDDFCRDCAVTGCFLCCGCCLHNRRQQEGHLNHAPNFCCPWICLSLIVLVGVLVLVSSDEITWTLEANETRHVPTGFWTQSVTIEADPSSEISVFSQSGDCPALSGSTQLIRHEPMHLAPGDYQYDTFYMTKGSGIHVNASQLTGSTNLYLYRGFISLDDDEAWGPALRAEFVSSTMTNDVSVEFSVPETDQYTIVYDNASGEAGDLVVDFNITLRTYNLDEANRFCWDEHQACRVEHAQSECIIIKAPSQVATVEITYTPNWVLLWALILGPFMVGLLRIGIFVMCARPYSEQPTDRNDKFASYHVPTTIPEAVPLQLPRNKLEDDYESLPVAVAETVIPLPDGT